LKIELNEIDTSISFLGDMKFREREITHSRRAIITKKAQLSSLSVDISHAEREGVNILCERGAIAIFRRFSNY